MKLPVFLLITCAFAQCNFEACVDEIPVTSDVTCANAAEFYTAPMNCLLRNKCPFAFGALAGYCYYQMYIVLGCDQATYPGCLSRTDRINGNIDNGATALYDTPTTMWKDGCAPWTCNTGLANLPTTCTDRVEPFKKYLACHNECTGGNPFLKGFAGSVCESVLLRDNCQDEYVNGADDIRALCYSLSNDVTVEVGSSRLRRLQTTTNVTTTIDSDLDNEITGHSVTPEYYPNFAGTGVSAFQFVINIAVLVIIVYIIIMECMTNGYKLISKD